MSENNATQTSSRAQQLVTAVAGCLGDKVQSVEIANGEVTIEVAAADLINAARILRDNVDLSFKGLVDLCGVDYAQYGKAEWETDESSSTGFGRGVDNMDADTNQDGRFAVVYHLISHEQNTRLRMRVHCPDNASPIVDSVNDIWPAANWFERECFDLYGILFNGHPDLRRILTDYGFVGHPFRKDFPLIGNVELRYDEEKKRVVYEPVSIEPRVLVPKVIRDDHRYSDQEDC